MKIAGIDITPLRDGVFISPPQFFGPDVDMSGHQELLDSDGMMRLPIGCFLLRGLGDRTVLVDAGIGLTGNQWLQGGQLLDELSAAGCRPHDIDLVVCSHLHVDHCGWLIDEDQATAVFANATVWAGAGDWRHFVDESEGMMLDHVRHGLRSLAEAGRVELVEGDQTILPGVSALAAPGHTPGHVVVVISAGDERALLLGDAITCPAQLDETDWGAISDVDRDLAHRTRERLWRELEGDGTLGTGAHFPELQFGRVLRGDGRRYWS